MIAPAFEPGPVGGIESFSRGMDQGQSWMQRSQAMRTQEQEQQIRAQEIAQNEILRPVIQAKALADISEAHSKVINAQIVQQHRQQASAEAPAALADFLAIVKNPDLDDRAAQLDGHAAKIAWLGDLPEYKPLLDAVNDARGKAHMEAIANGKIAQLKEAAAMRAATAEGQIEQRAKAAELAAQTKVEMQAKDIAHKKEVDELNLKLKQMQDKTTQRGQDVMAGRPANQAAIKANEELLQGGQAAAQELVGVNRALELLQDPTLRTGTGAQFALAAKRLGGAIGLETGDAQNIEQLQSVLGTQLLDRAKSIKGRLTNTEIGILNHMSPDIAKTPEGNRALLTMIQKANERQVNVAKIINDGRQQGLSERELQLESNHFLLGDSTGVPPSGTVIKSVKKIE